MLVEPRHDLDEIAGPVAVIELVHQDLVPGVPAGAGRARQAENIRSRRRRPRWRASGSPRCRSCVKLAIRNSVAKPSMRFSNSGSTASGVTSRPVKPVPPVVMITSIGSRLDPGLTRARIASTSSGTMSRSATVWPAAAMRSASVAPDLSSARSRVSEPSAPRSAAARIVGSRRCRPWRLLVSDAMGLGFTKPAACMIRAAWPRTYRSWRPFRP